jgi:2-oxoglutarate ferredoxin oxidoreductase subunit alpha
VEDRRDRLSRVNEDLQDGAETLVISYGITARSAREAVRMARDSGYRISHLVVHSVWPVPEEAIGRAAEGVRRVVVPELNMGQYRLEVERIVRSSITVTGVNKMNTTLLSPDEILRGIIP